MSYSDFKADCAKSIFSQGSDPEILKASSHWFSLANKHRYSYNFECFGRPLIQYPQDIVQLQEIISSVKPDVIVETGIAHGGSVVLSASMLSLLDIIDGIDPRLSNRKVIAVDVDIRSHNKAALDNHPFRFKMHLIEGSSVAPDVVAEVHNLVGEDKKVLVILDSNHTHDHVLDELNAYSSLVSVGSYCIVFDTVIEDLPPGSFPDRPWDVGNNPKTAVHQWLKSNPDFIINKNIDDKLLISVGPSGYLLRSK